MQQSRNNLFCHHFLPCSRLLLLLLLSLLTLDFSRRFDDESLIFISSYQKPGNFFFLFALFCPRFLRNLFPIRSNVRGLISLSNDAPLPIVEPPKTGIGRTRIDGIINDWVGKGELFPPIFSNFHLSLFLFKEHSFDI